MKKIMMKNSILTLLLAIVFNSAFAQNSNLVIFSEQGERFTVILNGIKQNANPETNVKITDLNQPSYKLKIIFEQNTIPDFDKNVTFMESGTEMVLNVKKNNKDEYVLRFVSQAPTIQSAPAPNQTVIVYSTTPPPAAVTTTTTTTTTTTGHGTGDNINLGMNIDGVGLNVNVNMGAPMGGISSTSSSTTTTSYSTSTTTSQPAPAQNVYVMPGYNGPVGCPWPMSQSDFMGVKNSISSKSFEDSKLQIAKQVIGSNCLFSSQVREIMLLFNFEDTRLNLAKYAYGYTFDLGNFYKVNDTFTFESSIDELNDYISTGK